MPSKEKIDGIETAKAIKDIADIPFIFVTAYATDEIIERASQTGCYGYLIKPFRDKELLATVKMTVHKHHEQSSIQKALQSTVNDYSLQYDNIYKDTSNQSTQSIYF